MSNTTTNPVAAAAGGGLSRVKNIVLVLSGKGGVGKSTICCQLAMYLAMQPYLNAAAGASSSSSSAAAKPVRVGIIDADLCGPSVTRICGADGISVMQAPGVGWKPVRVPLIKTGDSQQQAGGGDDDATAAASSGPHIYLMSMASLLNNDKEAVVWRGPRKDAMIKQFVTGVEWGELDYLFIDTPPGTSDEHLTLCELLLPLNPAGAVVVTTPQGAATDDVRKELHFLSKLKMRCLGIVENMSGFVCPHCTTKTNIFSTGGGERLAQEYETRFLGRVPIDPVLSYAEDMGVALWEMLQRQEQQQQEAADADESGPRFSKSASAAALEGVVSSVLGELARLQEVMQAQADAQ
jgi:Mrp family chromosome partitioning ATPase